MKTWLLFATMLCLAGTSQAGTSQAAEAPFTPGQRAQIVQIVREALKADPSILREAVESLQAAEEAQSQADAKHAIADHHQVLVANPGDPVAGNPAGDVTLVEFYDPRCPYCKRMLPSIDALVAHDPQLRVVYKDIPVLGPASLLEAKAIVAAQAQGGYLKMQAALMRSAAQPTEDGIRQTAKDLGLDGAKLVADMSGPAVAQRIQGNMLLAKSLKVQGTPVFVIGDTLIPGAVEQPALEAAIADARKHPVN